MRARSNGRSKLTPLKVVIDRPLGESLCNYVQHGSFFIRAANEVLLALRTRHSARYPNPTRKTYVPGPPSPVVSVSRKSIRRTSGGLLSPVSPLALWLFGAPSSGDFASHDDTNGSCALLPSAPPAPHQRPTPAAAGAYHADTRAGSPRGAPNGRHAKFCELTTDYRGF